MEDRILVLSVMGLEITLLDVFNYIIFHVSLR
jgi:hypothetical protein